MNECRKLDLDDVNKHIKDNLDKCNRQSLLRISPLETIISEVMEKGPTALCDLAYIQDPAGAVYGTEADAIPNQWDSIDVVIIVTYIPGFDHPSNPSVSTIKEVLCKMIVNNTWVEFFMDLEHGIWHKTVVLEDVNAIPNPLIDTRFIDGPIKYRNFTINSNEE